MAARRASVARAGVSGRVVLSARSRGLDVAPLAPGLQVAEIQRSRLLAAAVAVVDEFGYSDTTVTHITHRARVSRRTFYELFENREECLAAMFEHALDSIRSELLAAELDRLAWRERVRGGLLAILAFFDREPVLARVCVVQSLRGDQQVLERRTEVLGQLAAILEEGANESSRTVPALTAEGLVGAAHSILYARLLKREHEPLTGLLGDLMGIIVLPYLGPDAARREHARPAPALPAGRAATTGTTTESTPERNPLDGIPMRITYRTALVLRQISEQPGISNREVADQAGVSDQGQMSKLLSRLERFGLILNTGEGHTKGEPNAWTLTPTGTRVAQSILATTPNRTTAT
jgi:AcrR family transcriptional regulator/DNA-binding MarR family transcriptional regulator